MATTVHFMRSVILRSLLRLTCTHI